MGRFCKNFDQAICAANTEMSAIFKSLFGDCIQCKQENYAEYSFFKKHLKQKHDYQELFEKARSIGLIDNFTHFYPINILIEKLVNHARDKK